MQGSSANGIFCIDVAQDALCVVRITVGVGVDRLENVLQNVGEGNGVAAGGSVVEGVLDRPVGDEGDFVGQAHGFGMERAKLIFHGIVGHFLFSLLSSTGFCQNVSPQ